MICACGKEKNDGVRCKYGAAHVSLKESQKQFRKGNPHVPYPGERKVERERLPAKQGRFF
jgi:hypothetical protein